MKPNTKVFTTLEWRRSRDLQQHQDNFIDFFLGLSPEQQITFKILYSAGVFSDKLFTTGLDILLGIE